jgi:hypothetical protein
VKNKSSDTEVDKTPFYKEENKITKRFFLLYVLLANMPDFEVDR